MADSATGFTQSSPDAGKPPSESTVAYILKDEGHLYVAFRCLVRDTSSIVARTSGNVDGVRLFLDTYDDNASAYGFVVTAAGVEEDFRLTEDAMMSQEWDGVWRSAARRHEWGYAVEMEIPFASLRYRPGLERWGVEFGRNLAGVGERDYWSVTPQTGYRIAQMPSLVGVAAPRPGLHLEVYPVALGRYEMADGDSARWWKGFSAAAGLDVSWQPTSSANIQLTTLPDFAQIEADPYQVNLTRYELWLSEARPFFVEAAENFGRLDMLTPFYTRRIGRPLPDGTVVPILAGAKYTDRLGRTTVGALGVLTGRTDYDDYGSAATEPASIFSVVSLRQGVLRSSEVGLLYAGKDNEAFSNHGAAADFALRGGRFTGQFFAAGSQMGESLGYAAGATGYLDSDQFYVYGNAVRISNDFDLNGPGFTSWRGQSASGGGGPQWYATGPFRYAALSLDGGYEQTWDLDSGAPTGSASLNANLSFNDQTSLMTWAGGGTELYQDSAGEWQSGIAPRAGVYLSTSSARPVWGSAYANWTRSYNWRRGARAMSLSTRLDLTVQAIERLALSLGVRPTAEFEPDGSLNRQRGLTMVYRPAAVYSITPKMTARLGLEFVRGWDPGLERPERTEYLSALYSYTFRPRSTVYLAWNFSTDGAGGRELVGVLKVRYLFSF